MPSAGKCLMFSAIFAALAWFVFSGWAWHLVTMIREITVIPASAQAVVGSVGLFVLAFIGCYVIRLGCVLVDPLMSLPKTLPPDPADTQSEPGVQPIDARPREDQRRLSFSSMSAQALEMLVASATEQQRNAFHSIVSLHGQVKARMWGLLSATAATTLALVLVMPDLENGWFLANMLFGFLSALFAACIAVDFCPARIIARYGNRDT